MKTFLILIAFAPWLLFVAAVHYALRRKWRAYRNFFALKELRRNREALMELYSNMKTDTFVAAQQTVFRNIERNGDRHTKYAALLRDILAEAMDNHLNREDNV